MLLGKGEGPAPAASGGEARKNARSRNARSFKPHPQISQATAADALSWPEGHELLTGRTQGGGADTWRRFWQELAAVPTRSAAVDIFESHDRLFLGLNCAEREQRYAAVEDIVREKPDPKNSHSVVRLATGRSSPADRRQ